MLVLHNPSTAKQEIVTCRTVRYGKGKKLEIWISDDIGKSWTKRSEVTPSKDDNKSADVGDCSFLDLGSGTILISYRKNRLYRDHSKPNTYSIRIAVSSDYGATWRHHSTVKQTTQIVAGGSCGLWSSFLFKRSDGVVQCYYDDEFTPWIADKLAGHQYLMKKDLNAAAWTDDVIVCKSHSPNGLSRDGMGTVVEVAKGRLVCLLESVQRVPTAGYHKGCIRQVTSVDGDRTWSWTASEPKIIAGSPSYNALAPWMIKTVAGNYVVVFMTDQHAPAPNASNPRILKCKINYMRGTQSDSNINWGSQSTVAGNGTLTDACFWPNVVQLDTNRIFVQYLQAKNKKFKSGFDSNNW